MRSLSDDDLERSVGVLVGNEATIGQVIEFAVIARQREHFASIRGAIEARTPDRYPGAHSRG